MNHIHIFRMHGEVGGLSLRNGCYPDECSKELSCKRRISMHTWSVDGVGVESEFGIAEETDILH